MVPSSLPVTSHLPSVWKQTDVTLELCPSYVLYCGACMFHRMSRKMKEVRTGVDEELGISYTLIFL